MFYCSFPLFPMSLIKTVSSGHPQLTIVYSLTLFLLWQSQWLEMTLFYYNAVEFSDTTNYVNLQSERSSWKKLQWQQQRNFKRKLVLHCLNMFLLKLIMCRFPLPPNTSVSDSGPPSNTCMSAPATAKAYWTGTFHSYLSYLSVSIAYTTYANPEVFSYSLPNWYSYW